MLRDSANVNYQIIEDALPTSILQEDSITIEFNHILRHSQSDGFSLHILLIYMNEYENLFYTYYWAEYENITSKILSSHVKGDSVKYIVHIDSAVLKNKHCFSKNFNREDSQKIKMKHTKTLKQYLKTIKQND